MDAMRRYNRAEVNGRTTHLDRERPIVAASGATSMGSAVNTVVHTHTQQSEKRVVDRVGLYSFLSLFYVLLAPYVRNTPDDQFQVPLNRPGATRLRYGHMTFGGLLTEL